MKSKESEKPEFYASTASVRDARNKRVALERRIEVLEERGTIKGNTEG